MISIAAEWVIGVTEDGSLEGWKIDERGQGKNRCTHDLDMFPTDSKSKILFFSQTSESHLALVSERDLWIVKISYDEVNVL